MTADTLVSFRLDQRIKAAATRQARRDELTFSDVTRVLLKAYANGDITISIRAKQKKTLKVS